MQLSVIARKRLRTQQNESYVVYNKTPGISHLDNDGRCAIQQTLLAIVIGPRYTQSYRIKEHHFCSANSQENRSWWVDTVRRPGSVADLQRTRALCQARIRCRHFWLPFLSHRKPSAFYSNGHNEFSAIPLVVRSTLSRWMLWQSNRCSRILIEAFRSLCIKCFCA